MITLRIAVYDDLKSERDMVEGFLRSLSTTVSYEYILAEYSHGETMAGDYDGGSVDLDFIFTDIFTDDMLGMEATRCLRRHVPHVSTVFLTTIPTHALESYDVYAYRYLVKPLGGEKTITLLRRFPQEEYEGSQKTLLLEKGCRGRRTAYWEAEYIESYRNILLASLKNGEEHRIYVELDDVEEELEEYGFLRCRQSFIVNMNRVKAAKEDFPIMLGARTPIRQRGSYAVWDAYFGYLLEQAELTRIQYRREICHIRR